VIVRDIHPHQIYKLQLKSTRNMKKQGSMTPQRVLNSITELKDAEMPEKDFKS
jgi:hypothetical protein